MNELRIRYKNLEKINRCKTRGKQKKKIIKVKIMEKMNKATGRSKNTKS